MTRTKKTELLPTLFDSIIARDITEQKKLEALEFQFSTIIKFSTDAIISKTLDGIVTSWNPAAEIMFGYSAQEMIGKPMTLVIPPGYDDEELQILDKIRSGKHLEHFETMRQKKNGQKFPVSVNISPIKDMMGLIIGASLITRDITKQKLREDKIVELAFYDALTGLANRRLLNDRLVLAQAFSKRTNQYAAMIFMDLDNFKQLNDKFGHNVGDFLLKKAGNRIINLVRDVDTVARFGGDEFVVILNGLDVDKSKATAAASIISEKIRIALAEPYVLKIQPADQSETTVEYCCTSSIGVLIFKGEEVNPVDIIKLGDKAMYQAKESGKNKVSFYSASSISWMSSENKL